MFVAAAVLGLAAAGALQEGAYAQQSEIEVVAVGQLGDDPSRLLNGARGVDVFTIDGNTYAAVTSEVEGGLQIVDVTNPTSPTPISSLRDDGATTELGGAYNVDVFTIDGNTYAAVASGGDDGLQIVDVTTPSNPAASGSLGNSNTLELNNPRGVDVFKIGGNTYAAVASRDDDGLQIVNVTNPASLTAAGNLDDDNSLRLGRAVDVAVFEIGGNTYAVVASSSGNGLQIVNVSDPDNPDPTSNLGDNNSRLLRGANAVDVFAIGASTYAAVTSLNESGLQIVNVTNPAQPRPVGNLGDTKDADGLRLEGAFDVDVFAIGASTYAAVTSFNDDGLQIVNVTDPANPTAAGNLGDGGSRELDGASGVSVFKIGTNTYAAVAAFEDDGLQLVRLGADTEAPNSPPVAPDEAETTVEDTPVTITPAISDPDTSDTPVISAVDDPPNGTATHDGTAITYTPDQDYDGTDTFGYTVSDGTDTAQGTVTITITRDNNDPVLGTIGDQNATPDTQLTITPTVTDTDTTDTHTYSISRGTLPAAAVFSTSDGTLIWTPVQADAGQTHEVTITVNDGRGGTDSETFDIAVADTDPNTIEITPTGNLGYADGTILLFTASGVDVFTINGNTYAAVASTDDSGLQIVDVTNPASPAASGNLEDGGSRRLSGAAAVETFMIDTNTYAVVVSSLDDGLQIVDVTNPASPAAAGGLGDNSTLLLSGTPGVDVFTIGTNTYAAVASTDENGLQIVDVTDPDRPAAAGSLEDTTSIRLSGAQDVETFTIGTNTYAAVASFKEGLQIVNVTNPANPAAAGGLGDNSTLLLNGASGVDVFEIGTNTYAAVASRTDDGLQIVNISNPDNLTAAGSLGNNGSRELNGARYIDTFMIGDNTYVIIAARDDNGLQIVNVTNPASPADAGRLADNNDLLLDGASDVAVFTIGTNTYAAVAAYDDNGLQLVRLGAEAETPNSPPVAPDETATTAEDTPVTITPAISDLDTSDTLVISAVSNPPNGAATHDDDTITYTPDTDYDGTDAFTYTVSDGTDTAQGTITVTITRDNNDPVLGTIGDQNATPDVQLTITPTVTDADTTDTHRYSISRGTLPAAAAFNTSDGSLVWTPVQADAGQTHTVTITVSDGRGGTDSETFDIVVASLDLIDVTPVGNLKDDGSRLLDTSSGVAVFETTDDGNARAYAAVTSFTEGLQIVNVTNPAQPMAVGNLEDTEGQDELLLDGAFGVDVFTIGSKAYAAVTSGLDEGIQIVDITDPTSPNPVGNLNDTDSLLLGGAHDVDVFTIGGSTYAAVINTFDDDNGLQIVNVTNPADPRAAGNLEDDNDLLLADSQHVDVFTIGTKTYAAVASETDNGLQIVDVSDPAAPAAAGNLGDDGSRRLGGAHGVDVFTIGHRTYAAVTSGGDDGLQIVDVTDPAAPAAAGNLGDDNSLKLGNAYGVSVFEMGGSTYAAVASFGDDGLQIVNISDPDNPEAAGQLEDTSDLLLATAFDVEVFTIGAATYAVATARDDHGIQIVRLDAADATNAPPVAPAETATTPEDTPVTVTPAISDPNVSDTPVISAVVDPPNGTAIHDDTTITYTPDQDYEGTDTFGYTVSDGTDTAQGTITITVTRDNNDPVLGTIGDRTVVAGVQLSITPSVTDADTTDTHTYSIKRGTLPAFAAFSTSDGTLVWRTTPSDGGETHKVTITVSDGRGGTDKETFDIVVTPADPIVVTPVGSLGDSSTLELDNARNVDIFTIGTKTYAVVVSNADDGLQIVDVTDPDNPAAAGKLEDTEPDGLLLDGAYNVDVFTTGGKTYAAIAASYSDHGLQVVDVTDPDNPAAAGNLEDNEDADELLLRGAQGVDVFTIGAKTYAVVAANADDGLQIVDLTNPASPTAVGKMHNTTAPLLDGIYDVSAFTIDSNTYAAVASFTRNGLQIVDLTNPANPTAAGNLVDDGSRELDGARGVDIFTIDSNTYAAVASIDDDGLQIVNVTDPDNPTAAGNLVDDGSRELDGASDVDIFTIDSNTYAAVASQHDDGLQIVNVTDPDNPTAAGKLGDGGSRELNGAHGVSVFTIGTKTYAAVASYLDDGLQIVELSVTDDVRPEFASATLDVDLGVMTVTFSETVDVSATSLSLLYVSDTNETNTVSLAGADFDDAAADSDTIQIDLASSQRAAIDLMTAPQLDIAAGAVSDLSRNLIDAAADNTITTASPDSPIPSGRLPDSASLILEKSRSVDTFTIGSNVYAVAVSNAEDGFQIVDISRPDKPRGLGNLVDSNLPQRLLDGARGVATFTAGGKTYAAIASHADDGIQVFSVSDLAHPQSAGRLEDNGFRLLDGATGVTTFTIGSNTYAAVTSQHDGGLQLVNVTDPSSLTAPGRLEDGGSRLLADTSSVDTFKRGGSTYAVVASWGDDGLEIIDVSNPSSPAETGRLADDSDMLLRGIRAVDAFEAGGSAYVAVASHGENGLQIVDVSDPANPSPAGKLADGGDRLLGGASGVEIFWVGQAVYAAVASQSDDGLQIVDVSDQDNPAEAGSLRDGPRLSLDAARDLSVFTRGGAQYAVVASDTEGLQIVKLAESTRPAFASATLDRNTGAMAITFADVIDVSETDLSKLYISDISETNAVSLGGAGFDDTAADSDTIRLRLTGPQLAGIAPIVTVQLDIAADAVSDLSGGHIRDSPDNPITTASPDSPIFSGMLPDNTQLLLGGAYGVDVFTIDANTYAVVASSDENGLQIVNITDPDNPTAAGRLADATDLLLDGANAVAAFRIDSSTYAAVPSGSEGGLQIVDITDPDNPTAAGNLEDTEPANPGEDELLLGGAGGVEIFQVGSDVYAAVTSNTEGGLQIVNVTDPDNPTAAGQLADATDLLLDAPLGVDVFLIGGKIYATMTSTSNGKAGLQIIDITDPDNPTAAGQLADANNLLLEGTIGVDVFMIGTKTYAAVSSVVEHGLQIIDVSDPDNPAAAGRLADTTDLLLRNAQGVDVFTTEDGTYAAVTSEFGGLQIIDVSDPDNPAAAGQIADDTDLLLRVTYDVAVFLNGGDTYAVVTTDMEGLQIVKLAEVTDATDETRPSFESATLDEGTGAMTITFDETIDISATNLSLLYVSDVNQADTVPLTGAAFDFGSADVETLSLTLVDSQIQQVIPMGTPQLDITAGAVSDILGNQIADSPDNPITLTADDTRPSFESATLDEGTGAMTITFDETIDISATNLSLLYVSDVNQADTVPLTGAAFDFGSADVETLSLTLVQAQLDEIVPMGTPQLDITAGAVSDILGNQIADSPDNPITLTADDTRPSFESATLDEGTGAMTITFDETIDISATNLSLLYVSDVNQADTVPLIGAAFDFGSADVETLSLTLVQTQLDEIVPMGTPQLDITAGAVSDILGNQIADSPDNPITLTADDTRPSFESATLDEGTGAMTITFDETIDISATNLSLLYVSDVNQADTVPLIGAAFDFGSADVETLSLTLVQTQLDEIVPMGTPQLDISAGAVSDIFGNQIADSPDNPITVTGTTSNSPPLAPAESVTTQEDVPITITPAISDPDTSDTPIISAVDNPPNGTATHDDATITYTPNQDFDGTDTFGYTVSDGTDSVQGTITVTVTRDNNNPVLGTIGDRAAEPDVQLTITPTVTDADTTDTHTYSITRGTLPAAAAFNTTDGTLVWTPVQADAGQTHTVTIMVDDGRGGTDSQTFEIVVADGDAVTLTPVGSIGNGPQLLLDLPRGVDVFTIGGNTYAAVASSVDDGLQIIDVTDPASPTPVENLRDTDSLLLDGARAVDIFTIGGRTYAAVASTADDGLQIIDVTDPANPTPVGSLGDAVDAETEGAVVGQLLLDGARDVDIFTIGGRTYAAVASSVDNGLQIIDITDPASPAAAGQLEDTEDSDELLLDGAQGVAVFTIGNRTYAAVASFADDGLQLVDVTDPASPVAAGSLEDTGSTELDGASDVAVFTIGGNTYAAVASASGDDGLQIVDVTDPARPVAAGSIADGDSLLLLTARDVAVFTMGGRIYAAVTSFADDGLQIVDVTDPASPVAAGSLEDTGSLRLAGATGVAVFTIGGNTYAAVTAEYDDGLQLVRLEAASGISQFISLVGDNPLIHELGTPYVDPGATTDDGSPVTVDYSQVDVGVHGDYQVIYTAIGGGGSTETAIRIVQVRDTLPPAFASATLDEGTGAMAITFSEAVDISAANLSLLHVSDVNQADAVSLGGAAFDFGSADVETLSLILLRAQLDGIIPMGTPQLDISAGAVSDIFGNRIGGSPDNPITIPGRIQTDDDTDGDTVPPTGRSSGVGGGGGGGGGGRTGIGTTLPGAEAAYIASISWDCAVGFVTIAAGPASDDLAVSVRTTEHSVTRTTGAGQTPEGFAVFKAPMHESESYIGVSAILHSGSSVSSDYESVNVDACAGKRTYDVPVYIPASTVTQTAGGPGDAAVLPPVTPEPPAPMLPEPEPEPEPPVTPEPPAPMLPEPEPEPEPPVTPEPPAPVQPEPEPEPQAASEPGGACLIATAAYGTELAPQVQALREIRDGALLSTGSGSSFVAGFNTVYYSFSPAVADLERQNPAFREAVRIAIYPMISTLSIMSLAEEGSEASVLALGASVIALNIGMYAAAPAAVIVAARRLRG